MTKDHVPGESGFWVVILGEMTIFSVFFGSFLYYRGLSLSLYVNSELTLYRNIAVVNTLLLLTSSWLVVLGVEAARRRNITQAPRFFGGAILCGGAFAVLKILEYVLMVERGFSLNTNDFYRYYYILTGMHFLHVVVGMTMLVVMYFKSRQPLTTPGEIGFAEGVGVFWHMVDLIWLILFPLLYLIK